MSQEAATQGRSVADRQLVIGTAGHIDHGKTTLVRALTGVDTDRLKEEKERGITIELGFAPLTLPGDLGAGVVDVPGHERFVRHMVAGAFGIDLVVLVVAADEGVMPQTREHTDICQLLGVDAGLVALTKTDMVDPELIELAAEDVTEHLEGTFLEGAPVIPVSAQSGEGLDALREALAKLARERAQHESRGVSLLPVDRVFTVKGFGTVVTGTTVSGTFDVGDSVDLLPGGQQAKIRGLQVHGESVERALSGQRTAINLGGISHDEISRGTVIAETGRLSPTHRVDAQLDLLPLALRPMKHRARGMLFTGTSSSLCTVLLQDRDELQPGDAAPAQLLLETAMVTLPGDRFILRGFTTLDNYGYTIGGGEVLDPQPRRHRRKQDATRAHFEALSSDELGDRIQALVRSVGIFGLSRAELERRLRFGTRKALGRALEQLQSQRVVVRFDAERGALIHGEHFERLKQRALEIVDLFHGDFPAREGISREELRHKLHPELDARLFQVLLDAYAKSGTLVADGKLVRREGHRARVAGELTALADRIAALYHEAGLTPPLTKEVAGAVQADVRDASEVLESLLTEGRLVRVKPELYFDAGAITQLREDVARFFEANDEMTTGQFKEMTGTTRKYAIPLSEYLDRERVTIRVGDVRRAR